MRNFSLNFEKTVCLRLKGYNDVIYLECSVIELIHYAKHEFENLKAQNSHAAY